VQELLIAGGYAGAALTTIIFVRSTAPPQPRLSTFPMARRLRFRISFRWGRHATHDVLIAVTYLVAYGLSRVL
jgi:hypothetical protein